MVKGSVLPRVDGLQGQGYRRARGCSHTAGHWEVLPHIQPGRLAQGLGWIKKEHAQGRAHAAEGCGAESSEAFYQLYSAADAPSTSADLRELKPPGKLWTTAFTHPRQQQALRKLLSREETRARK